MQNHNRNLLNLFHLLIRNFIKFILFVKFHHGFIRACVALQIPQQGLCARIYHPEPRKARRARKRHVELPFGEDPVDVADELRNAHALGFVDRDGICELERELIIPRQYDLLGIRAACGDLA